MCLESVYQYDNDNHYVARKVGPFMFLMVPDLFISLVPPKDHLPVDCAWG